jgi:hypothetical protein
VGEGDRIATEEEKMIKTSLELLPYVEKFNRVYKPYLDPGQELRVNVYLQGQMVCVEFYPDDAPGDWDFSVKKGWPMSDVSLNPHVDSKGILVMRDDRQENWTEAMAQTDADGILARLMRKELRAMRRPKARWMLGAFIDRLTELKEELGDVPVVVESEVYGGTTYYDQIEGVLEHVDEDDRLVVIRRV